jgi:hypothetical protein
MKKHKNECQKYVFLGQNVPNVSVMAMEHYFEGQGGEVRAAGDGASRVGDL